MTTHNFLSDRVQQVKPSATLAVAARATKMQAEGFDIINLGVGEPDFDTPEFIKEAAIKAIRDGFTKYTAVDGIPSLKAAICDKFINENNLEYKPNQILVSCGCKQSIYNLAQAVLNDGDEVIIPAPYWVSYPDMMLLAGAKPVIVSTSYMQHYKITPDQLAAAITPQTKMLIINSPSNPSGMGYTKNELRALGEVLLKHPKILIATDDMYEHIWWAKEPFSNIVNACPELYDRTIVFNGVSKAYAMTGWRIGYAAGDAKIIAAMTKIQSQSTSNPTSISQVAAQVALSGDQACVREMCAAFKKRHDYLVSELNKIPGIACHASDGTFYAFPEISGLIAEIPNVNNDVEFADYLLTKTGLALVPGTAFGAVNSIRFSFATSMKHLEAAIVKLKEVL